MKKNTFNHINNNFILLARLSFIALLHRVRSTSSNIRIKVFTTDVPSSSRQRVTKQFPPPYTFAPPYYPSRGTTRQWLPAATDIETAVTVIPATTVMTTISTTGTYSTRISPTTSSKTSTRYVGYDRTTFVN